MPAVDSLTLCPFCGSPKVFRDYGRQDGGVTWPGRTSCERTLPMNEWAAAVLGKSATALPR